MVRPWNTGNYLKIGHFSVFVFVGTVFRIRDKYDMGRA